MTDKPGNQHDEPADDEAIVRRAWAALQDGGPPAHLDSRILAESRRVAATEDRTVVKVHRWRDRTRYFALAATVIVAVPLVVSVFERHSPPAYDPTAGDTSADPVAKTAEAPGQPPGTDNAGPSMQSLTETPFAATDTPLSPADSPPTRQERRFANAPPSPDSAEESAGPGEVAPDRSTATAIGNRQTLADGGLPDAAAPRVAAGTTDPVADSPRPDSAGWSRAEPAGGSLSARRDGGVAPLPVEDDAATPERAVREFAASPPSRQTAADYSDGFAMTTDQADVPVARSQPAERTGPGARELMTVKGRPTDPATWLDHIAGLVDKGRVRAAREQLGRLLASYPDFTVPEEFPLAATDAVAPDSDTILPPADDWLREIGRLAERGRVDLARVELAEFLLRYPDYPLPDDFPLTRADAAPIER